MRWITLASLLLILSGLVMWDRSLSSQQSETRRTSARITSLLDESILDDRFIAALRVDVGEEDIYLYVHQRGLWRCLAAHGAPAENELVESILPALLEAQGVVRSTDPADAADYGFDGPDALRVSFSGEDVYTDPAGDVIFAVDLGRSIQRTGGSYVRPVGTDTIYAIDRDVRAILNVDFEQRIPPMLDPHIVPQAWPGTRAWPARIVVQPINQPPLVITRREGGNGEAPASGAAFDWIVSDGESEYVGDMMQVTSFVVYLMRVPYAGILSPRPAAEVGLDPPQAQIMYETLDGHSIQLAIGGAGPRGGVVVANSFTQLLYEVDPELAGQMLPQLDMLLSPEQGNPWEQWMRR